MIHAQPLPEEWTPNLQRDEASAWDRAPDCDDEAEAVPVRPVISRSTVSAVDIEATLLALIERMVDRDERALAALYDATSARVHGLVLRMTRRPALAEEVVEDTYWQAWRQAPRFEAGRGRVITWLLAMARSRAIDALRRDERFRHDDMPDEEAPQPTGDNPMSAPDLLDALRGEARVHDAVAALEPRARQLIAMAFFKGMTHEEIATRTATPLGTVKSLIRRSLQQLRHLLDDVGAA